MCTAPRSTLARLAVRVPRSWHCRCSPTHVPAAPAKLSRRLLPRPPLRSTPSAPRRPRPAGRRAWQGAALGRAACASPRWGVSPLPPSAGGRSAGVRAGRPDARRRIAPDGRFPCYVLPPAGLLCAPMRLPSNPWTVSDEPRPSIGRLLKFKSMTPQDSASTVTVQSLSPRARKPSDYLPGVRKPAGLLSGATGAEKTPATFRVPFLCAVRSRLPVLHAVQPCCYALTPVAFHPCGGRCGSSGAAATPCIPSIPLQSMFNHPIPPAPPIFSPLSTGFTGHPLLHFGPV